MNIFITGASGLLGGSLAKALSGTAKATGAGHSRPARAGTDSTTLDIADPASVAAALDGKGYTHVIHCAAIRSPEECAADIARAYRVNAAAVEYLAEACNRNNSALVHVSTDYVFAGDAPPYREDSRFGPKNVYGRSKLAGEFAARSAATHLVARIPALWGEDPADAKGNQADFLNKFRLGVPFPVENTLVRHYSLAGDIANAIAFCVGAGMTGTVHLSARESQTKADYARALATLHGFDPALVVNAGVPAGSDLRPFDSTLDSSRYEAAGGPRIRGLSEAVRDLAGKRG